MSDLAVQISQPLNRPVIDKTGLKAHYDVRVDITPYLTVSSAAGDGKEPLPRKIQPGRTFNPVKLGILSVT
jgi:uncharacterized protein (TIGR03435 family)